VATTNKVKAQQESKSAQIKSVGQAEPDDLALINQYTRTPLVAGQVYTMKLTLCDNEVDRQYDQFTLESLNTMSALFVGKTVMFDHAHSAKNQLVRVYKAEVETVQGKLNSLNQPYMRLVAMAYMLNLPSNADTISALDGGILKEGSVAFRNQKDTCSICGNEYYSCDCPHCKGRTYTTNGAEKLCFTILEGVTDAYEFSLVAVPAQPAAGVTKSFKDGRALSADTIKKLAAARKLRDKAMDCITQARAIEDDLVGEWPEDIPPEDDPEDTTPEQPEDSDDVKAFKSQIKFIAGGTTHD
jgi:hypothetical protein